MQILVYNISFNYNLREMRIEHIGIWVKDLENVKAFYEKYFDAKSNEKYHNPTKQFQSYFLSFQDGCRI